MIEVAAPRTPADIDAARRILREYEAALGVDLCFQGFEAELAALPGAYVEPRGALLTAHSNGVLAGCCARLTASTIRMPVT